MSEGVVAKATPAAPSPTVERYARHVNPAFVKLLEVLVASAGMIALLGRYGVRRGPAAVASLVFVSTGFMAMWTNWPHTRVAASRWIYATLPQGTTIAGRQWRIYYQTDDDLVGGGERVMPWLIAILGIVQPNPFAGP